LDVHVGDATLAHQLGSLRHGERIRYTPVGAGIDKDLVGAVAPDNLNHAFVAHFGLRIDRKTRPKPAIQNFLCRFLIVPWEKFSLSALVQAIPTTLGSKRAQQSWCIFHLDPILGGPAAGKLGKDVDAAGVTSPCCCAAFRAPGQNVADSASVRSPRRTAAPWGMCLHANNIGKAMMIGLAVASPKSIELFGARAKSAAARRQAIELSPACANAKRGNATNAYTASARTKRKWIASGDVDLAHIGTRWQVDVI
jgi:hypothetical protein